VFIRLGYFRRALKIDDLKTGLFRWRRSRDSVEGMFACGGAHGREVAVVRMALDSTRSRLAQYAGQVLHGCCQRTRYRWLCCVLLVMSWIGSRRYRLLLGWDSHREPSCLRQCRTSSRLGLVLRNGWGLIQAAGRTPSHHRRQGSGIVVEA
jgi:hypothetical protein